MADATNPITNTEDVIDSRDVIARIAYLEGFDDEDLEEEDRAELTTLLALQEEAGGASDWPHGETLIRDSYFEDYAKQLAEDVGAISGDDAWPLMHIDWRAAAESLQSDYTEVEFDGITYWIRW